MNDIIGRYASLSVAAERLARAGRPVPHHIVREMQQIESIAQTRLTPSQLQAALQHVEHAKVQVLAQEQSISQARLQADIAQTAEKTSRKLTEGWFGKADGLTAEQWRAVRDGKKVVFKAPPKPDAAELDRLSVERTRGIDPAGKGFTLKEWEKRLDELAEVDRDRFEVLAKRYNADPKDLRKAVDRWRTERLEVEFNRRQQARASREGDEVYSGEGYQRKAQIMDAMVEHLDPSDENTARFFDDNAGAERIAQEGEGRPGAEGRSADIARAMMQVESRGEAHE